MLSFNLLVRFAILGMVWFGCLYDLSAGGRKDGWERGRFQTREGGDEFFFFFFGIERRGEVCARSMVRMGWTSWDWAWESSVLLCGMWYVVWHHVFFSFAEALVRLF